MEQFEIEHVLMLKHNMGLAWGMNALMENLCTAPYVMLMEEDWLYMDETVRSPQTEQALSSIARAVALLKSNVVVFIDGPDKRWTTTVISASDCYFNDRLIFPSFNGRYHS